MSETLHTCPGCNTPNFTARGLKAHVCKGVKRSLPELSEPAETALAPVLPKPMLIASFSALQQGIKGDALAMKVKMFFAGLLVRELSETFRAEHGETRGGDQKSEAARTKGDANVTFAAEHLKTHLEEALGVSYRTCCRYRRFWEDVTTSDRHAKAVAALNAVWLQHSEQHLLTAPAKGAKAAKAQALALHEAGSVLAEQVQELLTEADEFGLHELFEQPEKDVTPDATPDADDETAADRKHKLIRFWCGDLLKRLGNNEFLRLPTPQLETLTTELEEALAKAKDRLNTKKGKRK